MCRCTNGRRLHPMRTPRILVMAILLACRIDEPSKTDTAPIVRAAHFTVPAGAALPVRRCQDGLAYFAGTAISEREEWYGKHLAALQEAVLCQERPEEAR